MTRGVRGRQPVPAAVRDAHVRARGDLAGATLSPLDIAVRLTAFFAAPEEAVLESEPTLGL